MNHIPFAFPGLPRIGCAFGCGPRTMAFTGAPDPAAVTATRQALQRELGFGHWHSLKQVHGVHMVFEPEFDTLDRPSIEAGDGLAESRPGRALAVKTADCQPVLLAHESQEFIAALHVGWRGNVADFCARGVRSLCVRYGLDPRELFAVRGPSLGPGESEFTNFEAEFGEAFRPYFDHRTRRVDLWRLTRDQLVAAGLSRDRIFGLDLCTRSLPLFFSYRRDKTAGRQASLIWIRP
ncbi:MAG: polyphenol oxidase family protein [Solidesulfovibrio sp.]|uniref:polyphenol oxidase family protein n=1 Tax=Solidesulfovibrio sp. TaxID=2910990 RepID=UPI002B20AE54|nr:polyphenol oxidase family protein [Solidesulfovibrio sp.]MEA4857354.1 polyphenol oxidase family protein [Solidesulfovibrio sp.]